MFARFQVFTAEVTTMQFSWNVTPCRPVRSLRLFDPES